MDNVKRYFERLEEETSKAYEIAEEARAQSKDPEPRVDIPVATDLPEKASSLVIAAKFPDLEDTGVPERIRELEDEYGKNDERVAFSIAEEIATGEFHDFDEREKACDAGIRVGVSYMTGGITTAPLEGIGDIKIRENDDGSEYLAVYYSGPIRSAGGTASAMSVLLADHVRSSVGLERFKPSETIVKRYATEVDDYYNRVTAKQYYPEREETSMIAENVPVEVTGSPTEQLEVSNYKDLDRVETNQIRGGMCLVYLDGLPLKAPKIKKRINKWGEDFGLEHWNWIKDYLELQEELHSSGDEEEEESQKYTPSDKYLGSLTAGRPVFSHPGEKGGFRLRYGHSRANGLAATSFHPATLEVTERFLAVGTQIKTEYPGKASVATPCDSIHPPVLRLENGEVVKVETRERAKELEGRVEEILFLGDILVTYGEFLENGKRLLPSPYVSEWWDKELEVELEEQEVKLGRDFSERDPTPREAFKISEKLDLPLHPKWTYHWREVSFENFQELVKAVNESGANRLEGEKIKEALEEILVPHSLDNGVIQLEEEHQKVLAKLLETDNYSSLLQDVEDPEDIPEFIEKASGIEVREQAPHYIGARMGRPEKAERRTLQGKPQLMFPCGKQEGGRMRNLAESYRKGSVEQEIVHNECSECGETSFFSYCIECGSETESRWHCSDCGESYTTERESCGNCGNDWLNRYKSTSIDIETLMDNALDNLETELPELLKSPRGVTGEHRHVEPLEKGLIREKHDLYVNKDGTVRYDATDLPLTHFKPGEISTSVEKLRELGYEKDINGEPLERKDQVVALKPQDIIIPDGEKTLKASDYFVRVASFVDELLEKFYGLEPFYNAEDKTDLVGELVIGLAPHTSGGTVGRIIGFTDAKGIYAHPYWHAAKRRNCLPGDEEVKLADGSKKTLRQIFEEADGKEEADSMGTVEKKIDEEVITEDNGVICSSRATKVYKAPAQEFKLSIRTASDREITVFPDHRMKTAGGARKARSLEEGDSLLTPLKVDVETEDRHSIDLINRLEIEDLMIDSTESFDELVEGLGGLKQASDRLGISKKTLGNYRYRSSVPLEVLEEMSSIAGSEYEIQEDVNLSAKRDTVALPRKVKVDSEFLKLLGYYAAEGYTRKSEKSGKELYQVCFAFGEEELKREIKDCIRNVFGLEPHEAEHTLTLSSRIVYELFQSLKLGDGAHGKKVPEFVKNLPKQKVKDFLAAYFAGDGSVEKGRLHVTATSVSRQLLQDIDFLLKRFGIFARFSTQEREAGGILLEKYGERYKGQTFTSHKLHIRSSFAVQFGKKIGFSLDRKQSVLEENYSIARKPRLDIRGQVIEDEIESIEIEKADERFMYDIEVEETHEFVTKENLISMNCDGDEDAILLLMDGLLNFSRQFLPDMTGARTMDAPLILSTVLNADEIDDEAWVIETVDEYPLEFYRETKEYMQPWEIDADIQTGEDIVHSENPFRHGFTHATGNVENGAKQSEYVTLNEMSEKTSHQLGLGEKVKAVDEDAVAELLLKKHFIPDIKGNLRSFSRQKMRCVDCNQKFRRVPLTNQTIAPTGKTTAECPECDGKVLLTISEGTIKKYMRPSEDIIDSYEVSPYVRQQILILKQTLQSLFGKENRQSGLKQFTA